MIYILFLFLSTGNGGTSGMTAEFNTLAQCNYALKMSEKTGTLRTGFCLEKGIK